MSRDLFPSSLAFAACFVFVGHLFDVLLFPHFHAVVGCGLLLLLLFFGGGWGSGWCG